MNLPSLQSSGFILCEGQGDQAFFRHLIRERPLPEFQIDFPKKEGAPAGKDAFGQYLTALRAGRGFEKLSGILVVSDNDDDPEGSFAQVRQQIRSAGKYAVPNKPLETAKADGVPAIVVLMLPWPEMPGNLETLCLPSAYDKWPEIRACLDAYCRCAGTDNWGPRRQSQMRMRCLLSATCASDPNTGLPYAWSRSETLIPLNHSCFDQVANFLRDFNAHLNA